MAISKFQLTIILGVVGVFVISNIAQSMIDRRAISLDRDLRDRIWKREAGTLTLWRVPEALGIGAMIVGFLKMIGVLGAGAWGIPTMAVGFTILCLTASLRAWLSNSAYNTEAPGTPASRSAFQAALLVTFAEVSLGCFVCWFVFAPKSNAAQNQAKQPGPPPKTANTTKDSDDGSKDLLWVDETEALRLLKGKDAEYLKALVARKDIRARQANGKTEYRRDDISAMKLAGLPSAEELKANPPPKDDAVQPEKPKQEAPKQNLKE